MIVAHTRLHDVHQVGEFLNELYKTYKTVEILGISSKYSDYDIFYKVGEKK